MLCKNKINYLWLNTIQQQPVPKAGGDLELSVGYVREKMAERHRRVLIILLEYQWNRKRNSSAALRQGYFCSTEADAHFLCCSPKTMQEKKESTLSFLIFMSVFFLPSLWNYCLWLHLTSFKKGCIPCSLIELDQLHPILLFLSWL